MKRKEELFQLIHSLDKHEKRFFKLFASIEEGDHTYLKIFDRIAKQKEYDEDAVRNQMGIPKNVFAVQKHFLTNLILNRIAILTSGKESDLRMMLTQADILYQKGLYSLFEKLIRKAKERAIHLEMYSMYLEVLRLEHMNVWRKRDLEQAKNVIQEEKKILELYNNQKQYTHLVNEIIILLSLTGNRKNKEEVKKLNALMKHPFIRDEKNALTFYSKYAIYHVTCIYYFVHGNFQKAYRFAKKENNLYELHPEKIKINSLQYLYSLHNLLSACNLLKRYDEAKIYIDKLHTHSFLLTSKRDKAWGFYTYNDSNLMYFIKTGRFNEGITSTENLIAEMDRGEVKLDIMTYMLLYFTSGILFFGAGDYKNSLKCMNIVRNMEEALKSRTDVEVSVRIFYLLIHYEKGNIELLEHLTKSEQRFLSATNRLYKFENILLDFFRKKIPKAASKKELKDEFILLKKQLLPLLKNKHEKIPLEQFDYIAWIDSKIEDKPFAEIVQEKAKK